MRIFVLGATGTLGRPVVQRLVRRRHEVTGLTRSASGAARLKAQGAAAVIGDALDGKRMNAAMAEARPEVVVHLLTALPPAGPLRARDLHATNQLRTEGTATVIAAAAAAGAKRIVAESFVGVYGRGDQSSPLTEDDPLPPPPDNAFRDSVLALRSLEEQLRAAAWDLQIETVALRFGLLYGGEVPSTHAMVQQARKGRLFVPGRASGLAPLVHLVDADAAIVAAVEASAPSGVYNIVDDRPVSLRELMERLAEAVSARPPRTIPDWLVKLVAPLAAALASARLPLDNAKAKRELGWTLEYPTLDSGLVEVRTNALPIRD